MIFIKIFLKYQNTIMSIQSRLVQYSVFRSKTIPEFEEAPEVENGKVLSYRLAQKIRFPMVNILDDVVLKKTNKKSEFDNQKFFSDKVLEQVSQHFPLVYSYEDKNDNILMMMEKFEGNYDEIDKSKEDIDEYISLLLQILMTLYIIDSYGKYHGDLNPGNLLYKKISREDEAGSDHPGYLKYMIDGEEYYVKHFNKLWVIADFEFMGNKGDVLLSDNGFTDKFFKRLFSDLYEKIEDSSLWDIENSKPLIKGSWMYDIYTFTRFTGALKMSERIFYMMRDNINIDSPVKAVSHIIKNNFDHLLLRTKP